MIAMAYPVNEIFYSLQGEGRFTGTPAVFVRFAGCNRRCAFCDTDFSVSTPMTAMEILAEASKYPARHVVFTGGEPTLSLDGALCRAFKERGYFLHIETNGSNPVPVEIDWVTCSPKERPWDIDRIDELKVVFTGQDVEAIADAFVESGCEGLHPSVMSLQPCSGANVAETVDYVLEHPRWCLSLQTHKLLDIQ